MLVKGSHQKKLRHFGYCPNRGGGVSGSAKPFIEQTYRHVIGGGCMSKVLVQSSFLDL